MTEECYPEEINPFGSQNISGKPTKSGKMRSNKKGKSDEEYPREINPFHEENDKERKKQEKKEKKEHKKQMKKDKKLAKKQKNHSTNQNSNSIEADEHINESISERGISNKESSKSNGKKIHDATPAGEQGKMNLTKKVSRTLDFRDKPKPYDKLLAPPRRVLELKSGNIKPTEKLRASLPDLTQDTHYSSNRNIKHKTNSLENMLDLDEKTITQQQTSASKTSRPLSLEINCQGIYKNSRTLSIVREEKTPSPTKSKHLNTSQDVKMYRTSSVSKKGKKDKRKLKLLAKRLKKKKKSNGRKTTVIEGNFGWIC